MQYIYGIIICLAVAGNAQAQSLDERIIKSVNGSGTAFKDGYFRITSASLYPVTGAVPAAQLITGLVQKNRQLKQEALWSSGVFAANFLFTRVVKIAVNRKRPFETLPFIIKRDSVANGKSFFSGHASTAFCTAAWLAFKYKKWYVAAPAMLWAGTVSYSRMYLGVHYPSDVLTGAVVGTGIAWAGYKLQQKIQRKRKTGETAMLY